MKPLYISKSTVPEEVITEEINKCKTSLGDKLKGKPDHIVAKMLEGKMKKFYEDNVLYE